MRKFRSSIEPPARTKNRMITETTIKKITTEIVIADKIDRISNNENKNRKKARTPTPGTKTSLKLNTISMKYRDSSRKISKKYTNSHTNSINSTHTINKNAHAYNSYSNTSHQPLPCASKTIPLPARQQKSKTFWSRSCWSERRANCPSTYLLFNDISSAKPFIFKYILKLHGRSTTLVKLLVPCRRRSALRRPARKVQAAIPQKRRTTRARIPRGKIQTQANTTR